ncbi:MAG: Selenide, water dikinase [Ilumatobacteraceae bacterium]|nr:Selenide, water dikinase [Ilumatobacteraceae bacterium]
MSADLVAAPAFKAGEGSLRPLAGSIPVHLRHTPAMAVKLTEYSHGAGCGCKLAPTILAEALAGFAPSHPDLLVGPDTGDDAAVWRFGDDGLVLTTDFFTPIVDDAFDWGRIAATNAVSDVYAMGGTPFLALNLVAWNTEALGVDLLRQVLAGGAAVAAEAGFVVAGGHSIEDPEPKYGMVVLGKVDPTRMLENSGFRAGDVLVLAKPLGVGVITTAAKRGTATDAQLADAVTAMTTLNADASRIALEAGATGATDVTGFGLLGHLTRALRSSGMSAVVDASAVPLLDGARELCAAGASPGGTARNLAWCGASVEGGDELTRNLLADPQTSGGLLFGVSPSELEVALAALAATGHRAAAIGTVQTSSPGTIVITGSA